MFDAVNKLTSYIPNLLMNFGKRSFETGYILGLIDGRVLTGQRMANDCYLSSGHARNIHGLHQFSMIFLGENHVSTLMIKEWIDTNQDRIWEPLKGEELQLVYALVRLGMGEESARQDFLNLMQ